MKIDFVNSKGRRELFEKLEENFGIKEMDFVLLETGKSKVRGFSGTMTKDEIQELANLVRVEVVGLYLIKKEENFLRLSMDACQVLGKLGKIKKNIVEINDKQLYDWIRRNDLEIQKPNGVYVIKHDGDFISCGLSNGQKLINHVPKERSVRKS